MKSAVVAGHLCLDILPELSHLSGEQFTSLFQPGRLVTVGAPVFSTGGAVSNTGLALHRLGIPVRLMARLSDDVLAAAVRGIIAKEDVALLEGIASDPAAITSYTLIINPSGADRIFLHCPGVNDTFCAADVNYDLVAQADLFHFGYPPLMRRMYLDDGRELVEMMRRVRTGGITTSLDVSLPDPASESGRCDWRKILQRTLPHVDIFLPSLEELLFMLRRSEYDRLIGRVDPATPARLKDLSDELLEMGVKIAVIKLGEDGLYLRTAGANRMKELGRARPSAWTAWAGQELWTPCFQVEVAGTTGAGDVTIAGFLAALLRDLGPRQAVRMAVAAGACNVESVDTLSGLRSWQEIEKRVAVGWPQRRLELASPDWSWDSASGMWIGKNRAQGRGERSHG